MHHRRLFEAINRGDRRDWYRIENKKDDVARVDVYEAIGYDPWFDEGIGAKQFAKDLREIKASRIELHINSPGGFAFDGVTMYNALRDHPAFVAVTVDGLAASAASILAMAGDEITMNRASELMVHDAAGLCFGQAADMEDMRKFLDGLSDDIAAIYADKAGGTKADWREAMRGETWYSAQEAVDAGLADRLVELKEEDAEKAKNRFDLRIFAHAGRADAPAPHMFATNTELTRDIVPANKEVVEPEDGMTAEQLEKLGLPDDATEEQINERLDELAAAGQDGTSEGDGLIATTGETGDGTQGGELAGSTGDGTDDAATSTQNFTPPPGTVLVDAAAHQASQTRLAEVENKLGAIERKEAEAHKKSTLDAAQRDGKFRAADRGHYENMWAIDAAGTEKLVSALATNTVPVAEIGHGAGADIENKADEAYPAEWSGLLRTQEVKA